tara:strand:+ start:288 stop:830 length:543 start_codon:yes stop_codon:yes gene_type:complete
MPFSMSLLCKIPFTILGLMALGTHQLIGTDLVKYSALKSEYLQLHINGQSNHLNANNAELNEFNYGLGFTYNIGELMSDTRILDKVVVSIEADIYSDSFSDLGYAFGASFQRRLFEKLDWGVNIGLVHEKKLREKSDLYMHPYLCPYLQTNFDHPVNVRILYVPPVYNAGIFTAQLMVSF